MFLSPDPTGWVVVIHDPVANRTYPLTGFHAIPGNRHIEQDECLLIAQTYSDLIAPRDFPEAANIGYTKNNKKTWRGKFAEVHLIATMFRDQMRAMTAKGPYLPS